RQPGSMLAEGGAELADDVGLASGRDHRHRVAVAAELRADARDECVDLPGEAIDETGLDRLDRVLGDDRARFGQLDLAKLGGSAGTAEHTAKPTTSSASHTASTRLAIRCAHSSAVRFDSVASRQLARSSGPSCTPTAVRAFCTATVTSISSAPPLPPRRPPRC